MKQSTIDTALITLRYEREIAMYDKEENAKWIEQLEDAIKELAPLEGQDEGYIEGDDN